METCTHAALAGAAPSIAPSLPGLGRRPRILRGVSQLAETLFRLVTRCRDRAWPLASSEARVETSSQGGAAVAVEAKPSWLGMCQASGWVAGRSADRGRATSPKFGAFRVIHGHVWIRKKYFAPRSSLDHALCSRLWLHVEYSSCVASRRGRAPLLVGRSPRPTALGARAAGADGAGWCDLCCTVICGVRPGRAAAGRVDPRGCNIVHTMVNVSSYDGCRSGLVYTLICELTMLAVQCDAS